MPPKSLFAALHHHVLFIGQKFLTWDFLYVTSCSLVEGLRASQRSSQRCLRPPFIHVVYAKSKTFVRREVSCVDCMCVVNAVCSKMLGLGSSSPNSKHVVSVSQSMCWFLRRSYGTCWPGLFLALHRSPFLSFFISSESVNWTTCSNPNLLEAAPNIRYSPACLFCCVRHDPTCTIGWSGLHPETKDEPF